MVLLMQGDGCLVEAVVSLLLVGEFFQLGKEGHAGTLQQ